MLGALFDYLENLSISLVMLCYPDRTPVVDALASIFALVKWVVIGGSFTLLFIALDVGVHRLRRPHTVEAAGQPRTR